MDRKQLKSMGVAARGYGNALFLDEGDEVQPDAVVFTRTAGAGTVFATDESGAPIEATLRTFTSDAEAFDYMYACLRDRVAARRAASTTKVASVEAEAERTRPSLLEMYQRLGVTGVATTLVGIATALGWLWISPFVYTREDTFKLYASTADQGEFIFPADTGLVVVAVCYLLATVNMAEQWSLGRHDSDRLGRRALGTAVGTAIFAALALFCMALRSDEIENPLYWLPPVLALVSGVTVAVALFASRSTGADA